MPTPLRTCARHSEIKSLLERGSWPAAATPDLHTHVDTCHSCSQLVLLTQAFRQDSVRARTQAAPRLEAPGVLWWRAQLRRRNAAIERMQRPLLGAQVFAVALSLIAAVGFLVWQSKQGGLAWLADLPRSLRFEALVPAQLQNPLGITALIAVLLAVIAAVTGALAYTTSEKR